MRLLRVELTNVRGLAAAQVRFASDGVTVVEAPNESGKTTLLEAVDILLEVKDSSRSQRVRDLQPVDRDVPSTIEVELTCGGYHLTCTKTYNRQPGTVLTIHAPTRETLRGEEAHDRLRAIVDAVVDPALYAALRFAQGRDLDAVAFGGSNVLAARLDAAAGGAGTADDGGVFALAREEFERWFTPTGRPGQPLQAAARELADAERVHAELADRLAALHRDVERLERIDRQLPDLRRQRTHELAPRFAAATAAVAEVQEARSALEGRRADRAAAAADLAAARRALERRTEDVARVAALRSQVTAAEHGLAPVREALAAAERAHQDGLMVVRTAVAADAQARHHCDQAQLAVERLEAEGERDRLTRQLRRVEELTATTQDAEAALGAMRLDGPRLTVVREAAHALRVAEAAHAAGAPSLRMVARRDLEVTVDGTRVVLAAGEELTRTVVDGLRLAVPELADLHLVAGGSAERLQAAVATARHRLRDACVDAGVSDPAEAERLAAIRDDHLAIVRRRDADLARELDGGSVAALRTALAQAEARLRAVTGRLGALDQLQGGLAEARETVVTARAAADQAAEHLAVARAAHDAHTRELHELRTRTEVAAAGRASRQQDLDRAERQLASQRTEVGDDATLTAQLETAERREQATARALDAATAALAALDPATVDDEVTAARAALAAIDQQLGDLRTDQATLRERLRLGGEDGLGERVQDAAARLDQARVDHRRTLRRAEAARLLHSELTQAREEAYQAYRAPLRELITRDARAVFGPSLEVELDEELRIVGRTLDGVTLPFHALSAGAREQLAILAGRAVAQLAGRDGVPFIIDDALGSTDPTRLERLGEVLGRTADAQVIVLTCVADRFRAVRSAHVVQLGDRSTATMAPATRPPASPPAEPSSDVATRRPSEGTRGRRRVKDGVAPPRQGRDRVRTTEGEARERARHADPDRAPQVAALTLDLELP
jgi:hypothetical protein